MWFDAAIVDNQETVVCLAARFYLVYCFSAFKNRDLLTCVP